MHRWTPSSSPIPITSLDNISKFDNQRICLRWCKVCISALVLLVFLSFCIIYPVQKEIFFKQEHQNKQQEQFNHQQQLSFDTYIQDISNILLQLSDKNYTDEKFLLHIQTKTLMILRDLEIKRKKDIILFLYERNLIQNNQLNLYGADLNNVELICPHDFHYFHLPGVLWSNAKFINCRLTFANLNHAYLINARFINSTLQYASLIEAKLDKSYFIHAIIMNVNFNGASLIQADFLQADIVQGNNFTNADLYQAKLTDDQLQGKKISMIKHDFCRARFPNGSFGFVNSEENLISNGNAELECFTDQQTKWKTIDRNMILSTRKIENITNDNRTINENHWGNCSFIISPKTRVYQNINLHSYSVLIDTNNATFSFLGFASCNESYFEINMYRSDEILHDLTIYSKPWEEMELSDDKSMHAYGEHRYHLPARTRRIQIYFGIELSEDDIPCYFDNITLTIHLSKTK
ncbi:unnamed protein product [Rotaria sp. Silwood2]|nr:unnamed protein product [Rotaria sp. Silwood2]CAF2962671.1 unnamed protein product [Rotaria sp. Silwood2]CAF4061544.1 unnamed protein product [Rotaria sp. Silwood2]CAF4152953.1 unnamed protein product [Rotaria sp. Silwood2]